MGGCLYNIVGVDGKVSRWLGNIYLITSVGRHFILLMVNLSTVKTIVCFACQDYTTLCLGMWNEKFSVLRHISVISPTKSTPKSLIVPFTHIPSKLFYHYLVFTLKGTFIKSEQSHASIELYWAWNMASVQGSDRQRESRTHSLLLYNLERTAFTVVCSLVMFHVIHAQWCEL